MANDTKGWTGAMLSASGGSRRVQPLAGSTDRIVTHNRRHLLRAELALPVVRIVSPASLMEELR